MARMEPARWSSSGIWCCPGPGKRGNSSCYVCRGRDPNPSNSRMKRARSRNKLGIEVLWLLRSLDIHTTLARYFQWWLGCMTMDPVE